MRQIHCPFSLNPSVFDLSQNQNEQSLCHLWLQILFLQPCKLSLDLDPGIYCMLQPEKLIIIVLMTQLTRPCLY